MDEEESFTWKQSEFTISAQASKTEVDAVNAFLNGGTSFAALLEGIGISTSGYKALGKKLGPIMLRRNAHLLQTSDSRKFPDPIAKKLRELHCGQLLAKLPENSGVATKEEISNLLFEEFKNNPTEFGLQLSRFASKRKDGKSVIEYGLKLLSNYTSSEIDDKNKKISEFLFATIKASSSIARFKVSLIFEHLDHLSAIELIEKLLSDPDPHFRENVLFLKTLDPEIFNDIADQIISEDFELHKSGSAELHVPYEPEWDDWLSARLRQLAQQPLCARKKTSSESNIFDWQQFINLRNAFNPFTFPRTCAALLHHGLEEYPLLIWDEVAKALDQLDLDPAKQAQAIIFLETLLNDNDLLPTPGGVFILDAMERIIEHKFGTEVVEFNEATESHFVINDRTTLYEVRLAAKIAAANELQLPPLAETVIGLDEVSRSNYLESFCASESFVQSAVENGQAQTYAMLLSHLAVGGTGLKFTLEQLQEMHKRFPQVVEEEIKKGTANTPGSIAAEHFLNASDLNTLHHHLLEAIETHSKITPLRTNSSTDLGRGIAQ